MFDEFVRFQAEATIEKVLEDMGLGWCFEESLRRAQGGSRPAFLVFEMSESLRRIWGVDVAALASALLRLR